MANQRKREKTQIPSSRKWNGLAGEIKNFTGGSDPYEAPESPEIAVDSSKQTMEESLQIILDRLEALGLSVSTATSAG